MILRRIANGVRQQDWVTVLVEVLVVVVGIFLGLQVDEWNEARKDRNAERAFLVELRADISREIENANSRLERADQEWTLIAETIRISQGDIAAKELSPEQCEAAMLSHTVGMNIDFRGFLSFQALVDSGKLGIISDRELRNALVAFHQQVDFRSLRSRSIGQDMANITDNHPDIFPRYLALDQTQSQAKCQLEALRSSQMVRNKLQSNLGRLGGLRVMLGNQIEDLNRLMALLDRGR